MWIVVTGRDEIGVPISNMVEEKPKAKDKSGFELFHQEPVERC